MIVKKPTIVIYTHGGSTQLLREICAGIEEEGVLYEITDHESGTASTLSEMACRASMLGVGIGLDGNGASLHIKGMNVHQSEDETTALLSHTTLDPEKARALGTNSARVIKRLPLRLPE